MRVAGPVTQAQAVAMTSAQAGPGGGNFQPSATAAADQVPGGVHGSLLAAALVNCDTSAPYASLLALCPFPAHQTRSCKNGGRDAKDAQIRTK